MWVGSLRKRFGASTSIGVKEDVWESWMKSSGDKETKDTFGYFTKLGGQKLFN